ncbi:hypothetical protein [Staphylococcus pseudintermedius]|uniref:hypothetical protein n=1 Tax=Staphylococcus pseudintermedius TaxID=283734 RepID=UPI002B465195|nr:hypothetical protein [Staphylococcus pseudintermedius]
MTEINTTKKCGLIMPISNFNNYTTEHWRHVRSIFEDTLLTSEEYKYDIKIVSEKDDVGILQDNIVNGIYESDIIICDVSGRNPNVMFELGMRIAFDKPVVIVKDELTNIAFDIGVIEYIEYPSNLNYIDIQDFKVKLIHKIDHTLKEAENGKNTSYLSRFGQFTIQELPSKVISEHKAIETLLNKVDNLNRSLNSFKHTNKDNNILNSNEKNRIVKHIVENLFIYIENNNIPRNKIIYDEKIGDYINGIPLIKKLNLSEQEEMILGLRAVEQLKEELLMNELPF